MADSGSKEQMGKLIQQGYELRREHREAEACDRWLEAWELVKQIARPEWRTTEEFDRAYRGPWELVSNWCQDLEEALGNAGLRKPIYHEHRLRYAREFLERFPGEDALRYVNFLRAQGEALWRLGRRAEAEAVYASLVERFPDEAWGYIGWADEYWLFLDSPKEYEKAEEIMSRALARPSLNDREDLLERLAELRAEWGNPQEQAEVAVQPAPIASTPKPTTPPAVAAARPTPVAGRPKPVAPPAFPPKALELSTASPAAARKPEPAAAARKPGRNDPCWCGSGKKYKKCHLQADEEASRR